MKPKFRVRDSYGEVDFKTDKCVVETILNAWNYEADVYAILDDGTEDLIFHGWLDNEELSEMLAPYDLKIIDRDKHRYLQHVKTKEIFLGSWQEPPVRERETE